MTATILASMLASVAAANDFAEESYRIGEARRLDQMARQLDLNYRMIWQAGYGPRFPDPFEPWPRVPGDIWGYPAPRPIEHPIGYESRQTGPNRWIYRPVYAGQMQPAEPAPARARPVAPQWPGPSDPEPAAEGPREF